MGQAAAVLGQMMGESLYQAKMGDVREGFLTTHWSLIEEIQAKEGSDRALIGGAIVFVLAL